MTMNKVSREFMRAWADLGPRFLPFADAASAEVPLGRLLRLALFQVAVGMALVLLVGTLNRVMIVELSVPASLVGIMVSLPLLFAPFRALIGFRSDTHRSQLGWRRVPFIFRGAMVQFGGLAIMPFALLVLAGAGQASEAPVWVGWIAGGLAFLLVGAGLHTIQTIGLALATDLAPTERQPQVVGLMYVMLLLGMVVSSLAFGAFLADFSPQRLVSVIQAAAVLTLIMTGIALWKQEARGDARRRQLNQTRRESFQESWARFIGGGQARRRLLVVGLGTIGFTMADVLLEPYGGQVLGLSVGDTTKLTATLAIGGLSGFALASRVLSRGVDPFRMAAAGTLVGIPAFVTVLAAAPLQSMWMFGLGTAAIGFGGGLFGHGTLTATMNLAPREQTGLALGAWGAVQASTAGLGIALGGIIRDVVAHAIAAEPVLPAWLAPWRAAAGYGTVYGLEITFLCVTLVAMVPLMRKQASGIVLARAPS